MENRIEEHPILGVLKKGRTVTFTYDGKELTGCVLCLEWQGFYRTYRCL